MTLLVPPSPGRSIVLLAPRVGPFATMVFAATEFATQVLPTRIPRMREEANLTTAALDHTACQIGMTGRNGIAQNGIQRHLILTNKRKDAIVLMPIPTIPAKFKNFAESYGKKARFLVRMWSVLCISPSYSLDANASRGRAGIFLWICTNDVQASRTTDSSVKRSRDSLPYQPVVFTTQRKPATGKEKPGATKRTRSRAHYLSSK